METKEYYGGTYSEESEIEKCFQFDFKASVRGYGIVYARDKEQAIKLILNKEYDEIVETYDMEIEDITKIEEE